MAKYKVVDISAVRSFLEKVGVEASIPEEGRVSFLVRKKSDSEVVAIVKGKEKHEIPILAENYMNYLKYGRFDAKSRRGGKRGPRGYKTTQVLKRISEILAEKNGAVNLPEVWKILHEEGLVNRRPELYQIAIKYCKHEKNYVGNRKVITITGIKRF